MPKTTSHPLLILVDGSSYLYRAYHALPPLTNSSGRTTGAVYGVINMLRSLTADYDADYIAVVFDAKGKTFRDDLFDQYKAHRPSMPDDLRSQIKPLKEIITALGIPCLTIDKVEADDVIGTLAVQATKKGLKTLISTGDKDMAQLVDEYVTLINTMTNKTYDIKGVVEKFGIPPHLIIDYLALIGDTSDNIPGVPGVGPKTAVKWLNQYGNVDEIMSRANEIGGRIGERLRENINQLMLSRQLATIKTDVALELGPDELKQKEVDQQTLIKLYRELEFKRWLKEILESSIESNEQQGQQTTLTSTTTNYHTILTWNEFDSWLEKIKQADLFSFDTETNSLNYMTAGIVGISLAVEENEAVYIPLSHDYPDAPVQLVRNEIINKLKPLLEDSDKHKLGQNLKFDSHVLANHGINLQGITHDSMIESYVLNSTATQHDMNSLALKYLGLRTIHFEDIAGKGVKQITFNQIPLEQAAPYAAEDADVTLKLHHVLWPKISAIKGLETIYTKIEIPLIPVLSKMERNGVLVDDDMLLQISAELSDKISQIKLEAYKQAGEEFNMSSPKQIQQILFEGLGLPIIQKTPKGQPSTAESVLQELALDYRLPELILQYRTLSKLKSTYTDKLPQQINPATGRIHTSYHQAIAATGRLSSSNPNLQNIPVKTENGKRIREAFIAPKGFKIIAADYSQIELRILAHLSQDQGLLSAFTNGDDIHRSTAAEIFFTSPEKITPDQRRSAKAINFGLVYGMSAFGLARQLGIGRSEAQNYMDLYFARYPGVKAYMDKIRLFAQEHSYVETIFGRRLYLPEIKSSNANRRQYAERAAINAPMQGTAADIIKLSMLKVNEWLSDYPQQAHMIMQVHDELVFEVAEDMIEQAVNQIRGCMTMVVELDVPLEVEIGIGDNWGQAH